MGKDAPIAITLTAPSFWLLSRYMYVSPTRTALINVDHGLTSSVPPGLQKMSASVNDHAMTSTALTYIAASSVLAGLAGDMTRSNIRSPKGDVPRKLPVLPRLTCSLL